MSSLARRPTPFYFSWLSWLSCSLWLAYLPGCGDPSHGQSPAPPTGEPRDADTVKPMSPAGQSADAAPDGASPKATVDAPGDGRSATAKQPAVSDEECERFLDHFLALAQARHAKTTPAEYRPTAEQVAEIRAAMAVEFLPLCLTMDRTTYECGMQARDDDEIVRCMPPGS